MTGHTVVDYASLIQVRDGEYESKVNPGWMGNTAMIAYGGCTLSAGIAAACKSVKPGYHLYSCNGNYLGPAQTDRRYVCKVTRIRDTRTFATRLIEIGQKQDDGTFRPCMSMLADFQTQEPASMLEYSVPPSGSYPGPDSGITIEEYRARLVKEGKLPQAAADAHAKTFTLMKNSFESKVLGDSFMHQTLYGIAKHIPTTQDALPLTSRLSAEWLRARDAMLKTETEHLVALGFNIDGGLSFLPLSHNHLGLQDAGACSSLDFAIRICSNTIDLNQWHIKEMRTHHGSNGRTYSEARMYDQKLNLVAVMTQMNILRPKPVRSPAKM